MDADGMCDIFILPLVMAELRSPDAGDFSADELNRCCIRRCAKTSLVSADGRGCGGGSISWHAFNLAAIICVRDEIRKINF